MKIGTILQMISILLMGFLLMPSDLMAGEQEGNTPGEAEFTVLGNCGMCKDRIERAAYSVRGVRRAEWNEEAQMIEVRYRPNRTSQEEIERAIAEVGHDTENFLADDETYENLHHCCIYPRDPEMLENNPRYDED